LSIGESACQLADLFGDRAGSRGYFAYRQTGECLSLLGRRDEALAHTQRALEFARSTGSKRLSSDAFHHLGLVHYSRRELDDAREAFRHAIRTHPAPVTVVQLAYTETRLGELDAALASANQALAMSRSVGDQRAESGALLALGVIHRERDELELALCKFEASLEIQTEFGDPFHQAESLLQLGKVELDLGHDDRAREYALRANAIYENLGLKSLEEAADRLMTSIDERRST
jgi:tetratricopeptide (TPR) repeat protein